MKCKNCKHNNLPKAKYCEKCEKELLNKITDNFEIILGPDEKENEYKK
jgi:hypothetical protein